MAFITTMTWESPEAQTNEEFVKVRFAYLADEHQKLNTDLTSERLSDTVTTRRWFSNEAAEAWKAFVLAEAEQRGVTVQIDITEE